MNPDEIKFVFRLLIFAIPPFSLPVEMEFAVRLLKDAENPKKEFVEIVFAFILLVIPVAVIKVLAERNPVKIDRNDPTSAKS